ncbi:hypothetical protein L1049_019873 [Liquidambar formosana]|uniref:KIB1-4 beta-propeller domain-containing protein n=1 Tax=Liquidambar formosana TaxID=63359 RepID=A0AAP0S737_LIQFO
MKRRRRVKRGLRKKGEDTHRPWSDLPNDILVLLLKKLHWSDRIRVSAVCKKRFLPIHGFPHIDKLPWMMGYNYIINDNNSIRSVCKLADPCTKRNHIVEDDVKGKKRKDFVGAKASGSKEEHGWVLFGDEAEGKKRKDFVGAKACGSRHGWVLFSRKEDDYSNRLTSFIFSPFTDEVIELPALNRRYDKVAFSSSPALDADCVFFALLDCNNYLHISTCCCGDKNWKKFKFQSPMIQGVNYLPILDITYVHGFFSCVFAHGVLGAFSVAQQDWRVLADSIVSL